MRTRTLWRMGTLFGVLLLCGCGTTRGQRLQIYGTVLTVAGRPELGAAVREIGRVLETPKVEAGGK